MTQALTKEQTVNIQSSSRRASSVNFSKPGISQQQESKETSSEGLSGFADGVVAGAGVATAGAGIMLGLKAATWAAIQYATVMDVTDATIPFVVGLGVFGVGGAIAGYNAPALVAKGGEFLADKAGVSKDAGRAISATATGALATGLVSGSPVIGLVGAGVAGVGGLFGMSS